MQRVIILGILGLVLAGGFVETAAEVSVRTDVNGEYVSTVIVPGGAAWSPGIWSGRARGSLRHSGSVLNPLGDRFGDMAPAIVDSNQPPHHPWAVWSRFNGRDYDLVWSSWSRAWQAIAPVIPGNPAGDDLSPELAFTRDGRPLVTWWNRDSNGRGTVYFSVFLATGWMEPVQVSTPEYGGRFPSIEFTRRSQVEISYESDDGRMRFTQRIMMANPSTITDDIDPQSYVWFASGPMTAKKPQDNKHD